MTIRERDILFTAFLGRHKAVDAYIKNLKEHSEMLVEEHEARYNKLLSDNRPEWVLYDAFAWDRTVEGFQYWNELLDMWVFKFKK